MKHWIRTLRERPRIALLASAAIAALAILAWPSQKPRASEHGPEKPAPGSFDLALPTHETLDALARRYGEQLDAHEHAIAALRNEITSLNTKTDRVGQAQEQHFRTLQSLIEETRRSLESLRAPAEPRQEPPRRPSPLHEIEIPPQSGGGPRTIFLPAGTIIEGTLLHGAFAPIRRTSVPVEIELTADGFAPNDATVPIARAFAIAKAQGDANSERAHLQLVRLAVVRSDGRVFEREVNGYVSDETGDLGVAGRLVDRIGRVALLAGGAGALEGLARAAQRQETTVTTTAFGTVEQVTGDAARHMLAGAAGGAAERVADVFASRLEMIEPQIHIPAGRRVVVHILEGADLGIPIENPPAAPSPYRAVDARY